MSNVSTIYDRLLVVLPTLFTTRTRIPNPYSIEDNQSVLLKNGYGLKVNGTSSEESEFCTYSYSVDFGVVFTNEVVMLGNDADGYDAAVKLLLEASNTLQDNWLDNNQIGIEANITQVTFEGTSGIDFLVAGKNNFVTIEVSFTVQVTENL